MAVLLCGQVKLMIQQQEEQRLENQHQLLRYLFDDRLFFPPVKCPRRILECGYGRGHWALDMALNYPHSEVSSMTVNG